MHIDSESYDEDNNDQKRCVVDDLDDDLWFHMWIDVTCSTRTNEWVYLSR
jgi:hypothetical protein